MPDYDVSEALSRVEDMLIDSMMRNMQRHLDTEKAEGMTYPQWQAEQLAALAEFRESTGTALGGYFSEFNRRIEEALRKAYSKGGLEQEAKILEALRKGWKRRPHRGQLSGSFFRINDRRLNAYIASVKSDMERAEYALMRMSEDQYRRTIFNAGAAYNTGAVTLPQAVDSATRDFLSRGLNCIEYRNGRRVNIDTYAEMAMRTSVTRSYLQGESAKRDEWGVNTVIVNKRGTACPKCLQYVGKVFYDDVYGHVKPTDGRYPLLSSAIAGGLYHPNCKDIHTTYFEGVSTPPQPLTAEEERKASEVYELEQKQRCHERQIRKYKRLTEYTLDPQEKQKYASRLAGWEKLNADFVKEHGDVLRRRRERENARDLEVKVPAPPELLAGSGLDKNGKSGIIGVESGGKLEQAKTRDKKIEITDIAISKAEAPDIPSLSAEQNKRFKELHKDLLRRAKEENDSNEVAYLFDPVSLSHQMEYGGENSVNVFDNPFARDMIRNSKERSLFLLHNHPSTKSFSYSDIGVLLMNDNLGGMTAVANNGVVSAIYKTSRYDPELALRIIKEIRSNYPEKLSGEDDIAIVKQFLKISSRCGIETL